MPTDTNQLRQTMQRKLQFWHRNCPADNIVDGAADLDKCTCGLNDAIPDILQAAMESLPEKIIAKESDDDYDSGHVDGQNYMRYQVVNVIEEAMSTGGNDE